jgi:hypothetical protein
MGQADHTPGSNPRDLTIPRSNILGARDPPPLRFGAARSCGVSSLVVSRDVGLAKSGFRPTSAWVTVTFSDPAIIPRA